VSRWVRNICKKFVRNIVCKPSNTKYFEGLNFKVTYTNKFNTEKINIDVEATISSNE
jgi:uncharacterized lipoprotein YehR (DUF1307 family)